MFGWELFLETGFYLFLACFCGRKSFHLLRKAQVFPTCRLNFGLEKPLFTSYGGLTWPRTFDFNNWFSRTKHSTFYYWDFFYCTRGGQISHQVVRFQTTCTAAHQVVGFLTTRGGGKSNQLCLLNGNKTRSMWKKKLSLLYLPNFLFLQWMFQKSAQDFSVSQNLWT